MSDGWKPPEGGALDDNAWSERLVGRAIDSRAPDHRLHGYAVLGDLARHYQFSDLVYLALTGDLPDERSAALFSLALFSFAVPAAGEAPVHIAMLAKMSGAALSSAVASGSITAADQASDLVARHASLLTWLSDTTRALPPEVCVAADDKVVALSQSALAIDRSVPLRPDMSFDAARIALLHSAGVRSPDQMVSAIMLARIPAIAAEALLTGPQHLRSYPVRVPEYRYVDDDDD